MPFDLSQVRRIAAPPGEVIEKLFDSIRAFERQLDADHELAIVVPGAPALHATTIRAIDDVLLEYIGTTGTRESARLLQHVSQTSVMLVGAKKLDATARRVGFEVPASSQE